jgi:hypothetical protein
MLFLDDGDVVLVRIDRLGCSLHSNEYDDAKSNLSTANRSTIFEVIYNVQAPHQSHLFRQLRFIQSVRPLRSECNTT